MKASASVSSADRSWSRAAAVAAVLFLAAHLPSLAPSLEDIDSINFALGLRRFDLVAHQPHPPGYPVFIGMGRVALALVSTVAPGLAADRAEALALALLSALAGAAVLAGAFRLFRAVTTDAEAPRMAAAGAILLGAAPLFWMTALRPMSDASGLALVVWAQALAVEGRANPRRLAAAGLLAGLAAGVRVQAAALTVPLLVWCVIEGRVSRKGPVLTPLLTLVLGGLAWVLPLLAAAGGLEAYLVALATQAGEDFAWVDMLWLNPTPRQLAFALTNTFVLPWVLRPLAIAVAVAAALGAGLVLLRDRRAALLLAIAFVPYGLFHLLLQETPHVRYALPLLVPSAYLAARGCAVAGRWATAPAGLLVVAALWSAVPAGIAYGREPHPSFRAADALQVEARSARTAGQAPVLFQHFANRRALQASRPAGVSIVEPVRNREWLGPAEFWRGGGSGPVWFLADPRRTDLALIDPHARRRVTSFTWAVADRPELGGARPTGVDLYVFDTPLWFAGPGWPLTPEVAGLARAAGLGLHRAPLDAWVRRGQGALHLVMGGRHLEGPVRAARLTLALDGVPFDSWSFTPTHPGESFTRFVALPALDGRGAQPYARLTLSAAAADGGATPVVAVEQFDVRRTDQLVSALAEGWHEAEYDTVRGIGWRWTSERSVIRVAPARGFTIRLRGESPLRYLDTAPHLRVTAGSKTIAARAPSSDFDWRVDVSDADAAAAGGVVAIETDRVYLPGPAEGTSDARHLGVRLFEIDITAADPRQP